MKRFFIFLFLFVLLITDARAQSKIDKTESGITILNNGQKIEILWYSPQTVRVIKSKGDYRKESLSVVAKPENIKFSLSETSDKAVMKSTMLIVEFSKKDLTVSFYDSKGNALVNEASQAGFEDFNDAGKQTYKVSQAFGVDNTQSIYGLGILQNGKLNQRGENRVLAPGNTEDGIPFIQTSKGYGIFWDNYSATTYSDVNNVVTFKSECGDAADYYLLYGKNADGVVNQMRMLTGDAKMFPLWVYGFHQSKERYKSQDEIVGVLKKYRQLNIPIDGIIQDWQYWGNNYLWNAMDFLNENFSNPQQMISEIHNNNAHLSISIWSSFGPMTKAYKQLKDKDLLFDFDTWPQSGISHIWPPRTDYPSGVKVYNCYSAEARDIYWSNLLNLFNMDIDGWWMDSTEPDRFDNKQSDLDRATSLGSYRSVICAYPLMTVGGVFDHQYQTSKEKRIFILTRSGFAGQQRYGCNVWSGDVVSTWDMLRKQVTAGLNFTLTGNPYFNSDLGGFFAGSYNKSGMPGNENPAYRELYVRWMQQGVFTPMMRSHGTDVPRELYYYGQPGNPVYDALIGAVKLRYQLLPYIYSTAHQVVKNRSSFMRALFMDFPDDKKAVSLSNEYMFGGELLATPVLYAVYTPEILRKDADANAGWNKNTGKNNTEISQDVDFSKSFNHAVYLPSGFDWYEFSSNKKYQGGQDITLSVSIESNPFFVKAGSILPVGPEVNYSTEKSWTNLEIRVYPGADCSFTLYEDEFDNYNYENGAFSEIDFVWNNKSRTLTISNRKGSYKGMPEKRIFNILLPDGSLKSMNYSGKKTVIKF